MAVLLGELRRASSIRRGPGIGAVVGAVAGLVAMLAVFAFAAYRLMSAEAPAPVAQAEVPAEATPSEPPPDELPSIEAEPKDKGVDPSTVVVDGGTPDDATGAPTSEPLLDDRQTAALLGMMLDPEQSDPAELMRALVDDEQLQGPMGDIVGGVLDDMAAPPKPIEITRALEVPVWDGRSTFTCQWGDGFVLRDVEANVAEGPAFSVGQGCVLHVVDSFVDADVVAEISGGRLVLERVRAAAQTSVVKITMMGQADVRELRTAKKAKTAIVVEGGKALVRQSEIEAVVGVAASMSGQVRVEDSTVRADEAALHATMSGRIEIRDTSLTGAVEHEMRGVVVQLPSARDRAP